MTEVCRKEDYMKIFRKKAKLVCIQYEGIEKRYVYSCPDCCHNVHQFLDRCPNCKRKLQFETPKEKLIKDIKEQLKYL